MTVYSEYDLFLIELKYYETAIINSKNTFLIKLFSELDDKTLDKQTQIMKDYAYELDEHNYLNLDNTGKELFENIYDTYKEFVSRIICIEFNLIYELGKKEVDNSRVDILKAYKKYGMKKDGYEKICTISMETIGLPRKKVKKKTHVRKGKKALVSFEKSFKWERTKISKALQEEKLKLICPYCGAEYLFKEQGYKELDHINPRSFYPGLIYVSINLVYACKSCNSRKSNVLPKLKFEQVLQLHSNKFIKNNLTINELKRDDFLEIKKMNSSSGKVHEQLEIYDVFLTLPGSNEQLKKMNISEKYKMLFPLLVNQYKKFENNILVINEIIKENKLDNENLVEAVLKDAKFILIFDDWNCKQKEEFEILFHWRREHLVQLIKNYKEIYDNRRC